MKSKLLPLLIATFASGVAVAGDHAHWGYQGHHGAAHWGDMEEDFKTCKLGKSQSPINIRTRAVKKGELAPIGFTYAEGSAEVVNNGHTVQVNLPAGSAITLDGVSYPLLQFHFHTPSEEKINGKAYPLVAHFVHKSADGKLAVVAVLFKKGKENTALKAVFDALPGHEGDRKAIENISPAAILPADTGYYAFMGSLTTPPCSEDVRWQVLKTPVEASPAQLAAFRKLFRMNARPVQPLNGRDVLASR